MIIKVTAVGTADNISVNNDLRCPGCKMMVAMGWITSRQQVGEYIASMFRCPRDGCRTFVFALSSHDGKTLMTWPTVSIDFDTSSVPTSIVSALSEAIRCYDAQCYVAAAIMV